MKNTGWLTLEQARVETQEALVECTWVEHGVSYTRWFLLTDLKRALEASSGDQG